MKRGLSLLIFPLLLLTAVACHSGDEPDEANSPPSQPAGPALVMFYTDN